MRLVTAASGGVPTTPPSVSLPPLALVQTTPPPVPAAPSSDATAKIVEAMRAQQESPTGSDERVTLSDLTLIATASANQQLAAASDAITPSSNNSSSRGSKGKSSGETKKNPEAERREIEEIARHVLDEVERLSEIARERSGDPWEGGW
jgi:hypothetical protein